MISTNKMYSTLLLLNLQLNRSMLISLSVSSLTKAKTVLKSNPLPATPPKLASKQEIQLFTPLLSSEMSSGPLIPSNLHAVPSKLPLLPSPLSQSREKTQPLTSNAFLKKPLLLVSAVNSLPLRKLALPTFALIVDTFTLTRHLLHSSLLTMLALSAMLVSVDLLRLIPLPEKPLVEVRMWELSLLLQVDWLVQRCWDTSGSICKESEKTYTCYYCLRSFGNDVFCFLRNILIF